MYHITFLTLNGGTICCIKIEEDCEFEEIFNHIRNHYRCQYLNFLCGNDIIIENYKTCKSMNMKQKDIIVVEYSYHKS